MVYRSSVHESTDEVRPLRLMFGRAFRWSADVKSIDEPQINFPNMSMSWKKPWKKCTCWPEFTSVARITDRRSTMTEKQPYNRML